METIIKPIEITRKNFSMFGDLISSDNIKPININAGYAKRFDNLANINTSKDGGKTIVSIFSALKRSFPMKIDMMEKHPFGSQAFIPMKETTFLCFVAPPGKSIVYRSKKWKLLLNKSKLHAHKKHNFQNKLMKNKKVNYIRINIFPDGGISRIRAFGRAE